MAHLPSLDRIQEKLLTYLTEGKDCALVAAPGSGASTLARNVWTKLAESGMKHFHLDFRESPAISATLTQLKTIADSGPDNIVLIIDHPTSFPPEDFYPLIRSVYEKASESKATCFWVGALDARAITENCGFKIHSLPRSHVSFPPLSRDEILSVYQTVSVANECQWGEAIQYLLFDLCGNDFSLARGLTEYLYGNWTDNLYDNVVWDRINDWLRHDKIVDEYRRRIKGVDQACRKYLELTRLGGKPPCPRAELFEETDPALRALCLQGLLVQNLLPGFYQLRNLTINFLVQEHAKPWEGYKPELLFRRVTNERASRLLQDVEIMLRSILFSIFHDMGSIKVRSLLENKQSDREFIPSELNKAILHWASEKADQGLRHDIGELIKSHRLTFKAGNSIWARIIKMTHGNPDEESSDHEHLLCIDYLTFTELGGIALDLFDEIFSGFSGDSGAKNRFRSRWQEYLSKLARLRNAVAHLRNLGFQDMEDLVRTIEAMRQDLINYAGWR